MADINSNIITSEDFAKKSRLSELRANDNYIFWLEADSDNKGRQYLRYYNVNKNIDLDNLSHINNLTDSQDYNIRSGINEYGGGSYWLNNNILYFYNKDDSQVYFIYLISNINKFKSEPAILEQSKDIKIHYADGVVLANNDFIAVREIIDTINNKTVQELVCFNFDSRMVTVLDQESDFYAFPDYNSKTNQLLWMSWQHPNMPWDKSELNMADLVYEKSNTIDSRNPDNKIRLENKKNLINIPNNSIYQPKWYDSNNILVVSEHDKDKPFWNLYIYNIVNNTFKPVLVGEFELGLPIWQLATNTYILDQNTNNIYCYVMHHGQSYIINKDFHLKNTNLKYFDQDSSNNINNPIGEFKYNLDLVYIQDTIVKINNKLYFLGSSESKPLTVCEFNLDTTNLSQLLLAEPSIELSYISTAQEIEFTNEFGVQSYGFYYQPKFNYLSLDKPPLIVMCHGGPSGTTNMGYNNKIQYWTTRGFAVVDVNYTGSTTYGREYRDRINYQWGIIDVADCVAAAKYLCENNFVDKNNLFIRGSSAGGLIALLALYKYNIFSAGCCYYPVADLLSLSEHTCNFEKFYNHHLIGDIKTNEQEYISRSPLTHAKLITQPLLLFHGTDDNVVPINQSRELYNKLSNNNDLSKFIEFEGEGHGFRNSETIQITLEQELEFYSNVINS